MNIQPLGDNIVVEAEEEQVSSSGIIVQTDNKERPQRGTVTAVGPGKLLKDGSRVPMEIKVGDIILFKKYSPTEIELEKKEYLILEASDVLAIVK